MFFDADPVDCSIGLKFGQRPDTNNPIDSAFLTAIKQEAEGVWQAKLTKWKLNKLLLIECLDDKAFRTRMKMAAAGITFYAPDGKSVDMVQWIEQIKNFDPDELDDDLSTVPSAIKRESDESSPTSPSGASSSGTPAKKRKM